MDPLSGPDGTAPPVSGSADDALAGTGALPFDRAASDLRLPALPAPGPGTDADRAAVQKWMAEDRARADEPSDAERAQWTAPPRDVPPPRPVPPQPATPAQPTTAATPPAPRAELPGRHEPGEDEDDDEPPWVRERREEHEFLSQFGEWRAGARPRARGRSAGVRPGPALLLLVAVLVLVAWFALH